MGGNGWGDELFHEYPQSWKKDIDFCFALTDTNNPVDILAKTATVAPTICGFPCLKCGLRENNNFVKVLFH